MTISSKTSKAAIAGIAAGFFLVGLAAASAAVAVGDTLGTTEADITTALEAQGYVVEEIETEDGNMEVEVVLDGTELEFVIDGQSGTVLETETEDGDAED